MDVQVQTGICVNYCICLLTALVIPVHWKYFFFWRGDNGDTHAHRSFGFYNGLMLAYNNDMITCWCHLNKE